MGAPQYVPTDPTDPPHYQAPQRRPGGWMADRPGELRGGQPTAARLGRQGPDQGYALRLARVLADELELVDREAEDDVIAGCVAVGLKRASLFGRAPIMDDLRAAAAVWGFDRPADDALVSERTRAFAEIANNHHYEERRAVADAVPDEILSLDLDEIQQPRPGRLAQRARARGVSGPRVRFAPAPTGYLHVGSARAALFNWLFARSQGGELVLRIEDTDAERNRPELIDAIIEALEWLGIDWDEGPVHQSGRMDLYRDAAARLLADGRAYLVDAENEPVDGTELLDGHALRFRVAGDGVTEWDDVIRGTVSFENEHLEDFVVWRSNGTPTFLLANAVDDADMGITHIIRGEDLVSATPKILMLRDALGDGEPPVLAHLPLLVNEQRKKLSKRRDDVSVGDYRDRGYLPEAMANYLALLGWGPPDEVEIRPMSEIVDLFRLEDVNQAAAFFDLKKLEHFNAEYLRAMSPDELLERAEPWLSGPEVPWSPDEYDAERMKRVTPLIRQRVRTLADVPSVGRLLLR